MKAVRTSGTENYAEAPISRTRPNRRDQMDDRTVVIGKRDALVPLEQLRRLAGTGRDAAGLVGLGHSVVAVEPTEELRRGAMVLHPIALPLPLGLRCTLHQEAEPSL